MSTDSTVTVSPPALPADDDSQAEAPRLYRASPRYWVLAVAGLGATLLLLIDMINGVHWDAVFFVVIGLATGLWALWMATTRVLVTPEGVWVRRFSATYFVDYQQMLSASIQGRVVSVVSLVYHPRLDNGLVDTERVGALLIPGLVNQEELLEQIEGRIPA